MAWRSDFKATRTWDPATGRVLHVERLRDVAVYTIAEGGRTVARFEARVRRDRKLSLFRKWANPGCERLVVWAVSDDQGAGLDEAARRRLIAEALTSHQAGWGLGGWRKKQPVRALVEVEFDAPRPRR